MSEEHDNPQIENSPELEDSPKPEIAPEQESVAAANEPSIQASLQQLAETEQAEKQSISRIHTADSVKNIVEGAIHAAGKAVSIDKLLSLFPEDEVIEKAVLRQAIEQLMQDYQNRGVELVEVSSGFRFQVAQSIAPWVSRLWEEKPQKYSRALLETLALVAYRQPITRGEIEDIRGVSVSSQIIRTLVEREWIRVIGHRDVPGKPAMYATTRQFLDFFGLKKLDELPSLSEIRDLDVINAELDFGTEELQNGETAPTEGESSEQGEEQDLFTADEDESADNESEERIDIDVELAALKETYQQIDSLNKQEQEIIAEAEQSIGQSQDNKPDPENKSDE